jgi:UDP-N-acetylglucosamine transferase subunit ALG13
MMTPEELVEAISQAGVVVTHGGPATIALARAHGKVPLVVPRLKAEGEHVDDHQVWYARKLAEQQEVVVLEDVGRLGETLIAFDSITALLPPARAHEPAGAVGRFEAAVAALLDS